MTWQLWRRIEIVRTVSGIKPLVASWEKSTHLSQVRLRAYVQTITAALSPLPLDTPMNLHLDVDVERPERLLRHYDLENFLTPLFGSIGFPASRFYLVSARKFVGGGSRISLGAAQLDAAAELPGWRHFEVDAGAGASKSSWKEGIRASLACSQPVLIPPGPAAVRLAWRCSTSRNWSTLWKATGDAMGPVLGARDSAALPS
jgi:hypothetical protein